MRVTTVWNDQTGMLTINIPDRLKGTILETITISAIDAIELYNELKKVLA